MENATDTEGFEENLKHCNQVVARSYTSLGEDAREDIVQQAVEIGLRRGSLTETLSWSRVRFLVIDAYRTLYGRKPVRPRETLGIPETATLPGQQATLEALEALLSPQEQAFQHMLDTFPNYDVAREQETRRALGGTPLSVEDLRLGVIAHRNKRATLQNKP